MPRRKTAALSREKLPDQHYNSVLVGVLIKGIVRHGKYQLASKIVRGGLDKLFELQAKNGPYKTLASELSERNEKYGGRSARGSRAAPVREETEEVKEYNLSEMDRKRATVLVFEDVVNRVAPELELVSKRVGGANIQVPIVVKQERRAILAIRFLIKNARKRVGKGSPSMSAALCAEMVETIRGNSPSLSDKDQMQKMARANAVYSRGKEKIDG